MNETDNLADTLDASLRQINLDRSRFVRITTELYGRQSIYQAGSDAQRRLYDDAFRARELLTEYFALAGFRLIVDPDRRYIQLFPPGAEIPGYQNDDELETQAAVRRIVYADLTAMMITLRLIYDQAITRGEVYGDRAEAPVKLIDVATALHTHLKRKMPEGVVERQHLLRELRFRKLVRYAETEDVSNEKMIAILPTILTVLGKDQFERIIKGIQNRQLLRAAADAMPELADKNSDAEE